MIKASRFFWNLYIGHVALTVVVLAACVYSIGPTDADARMALVWAILPTVLAGLAALGLGLWTAWSKPIAQITAAARALSRGDLDAPLNLGGRDEIGLLARSLNRMRDRLSAQLGTIDQQRQTLEAMLVQLHEGVVVTDADGRILLANPAAESLMRLEPADHPFDATNHPASMPRDATGRSAKASQWVGRPVEECIPQHDLQRLLIPRASFPHAGQDSRPSSTIMEERIRVDHADQAVWLLARASDITLPSGQAHDSASHIGGRAAHSAEAVGRLLVLTDITAMTHAIQVKTDFVANASHELRTPLSTIRASLETLLRLDPDIEREEASKFLAMMERQVRRLEALMSDLLSLSRVESGTVEFPASRIELPAFLAELHERYGDALNHKGLKWVVECPTEAYRLYASPYLLGLVLDNLVDNAIKFTDRGGCIRITCQNQAGEINIRVADTGCGISPENEARVFERFYQVERSRSGADRGTGLGLSIVRHAVTALGGSVRLESRLGVGTVVHVCVPVGGATIGRRPTPRLEGAAA